MPTTEKRLEAAAAAFTSGTPSQIAAAVKDLKTLVHEMYSAASPEAGGHFAPPKDRGAEAQAVLEELARAEGSDSKADCQRALSSVEAFVAKCTRSIDHR